MRCPAYIGWALWHFEKRFRINYLWLLLLLLLLSIAVGVRRHINANNVHYRVCLQSLLLGTWSIAGYIHVRCRLPAVVDLVAPKIKGREYLSLKNTGDLMKVISKFEII